MFLTGRVLYGVGCGMLACAIPRFLDEMMPPNLMAFFGGLYTFSFSWAVIVAFIAIVIFVVIGVARRIRLASVSASSSSRNSDDPSDPDNSNNPVDPNESTINMSDQSTPPTGER